MWKRILFLLLASSAILISRGTRRDGVSVFADDASLVNFVGSDAGLYVEVSDLNRRLPEFANSAFFSRVESLPVYVNWKQSQEFKKLAQIKKTIEDQTRQPLRQSVMNLFGQSVVFAVYPKQMGKPAGVLLLKAADAKSLEDSLNLWNGNDRVKIETIPLSTSAYYKRTESKPGREGRPQFYFAKDALFAISDDEALIQDIVRRSLNETVGPSLRGNENYLTARSSLPEDCWAVLYFDPQSWRARWEIDDGRTKFEEFVTGFWKRCHAVAAGLRAEKGLAVDVVLHYDPNEIPDRWRRLVERTKGFPKFLNQVPAGVFLVFAGKQDLSGIDKVITAEMDEPTRQRWQSARQIGRGVLLGLDLFDDVLPAFRANWGVYVLPRTPLDPKAVPVEGLLAVELPPEDDNAKNVRNALDNALNTGFNILAATQNPRSAKPAAVKSDPKDEVHWIDSLGPYQPAYSISSEYLIFASSPKVIQDFLSPDTPKLVKSRMFRLWTERQNPEGQLLFIDWQAIRTFLTKNHAFLLKQAVNSHALPEAEAEKRLKRLEDILEVLDGVYFGIQIQEDRIHITTGGITAE